MHVTHSAMIWNQRPGSSPVHHNALIGSGSAHHECKCENAIFALDRRVKIKTLTIWTEIVGQLTDSAIRELGVENEARQEID